MYFRYMYTIDSVVTYWCPLTLQYRLISAQKDA